MRAPGRPTQCRRHAPIVETRSADRLPSLGVDGTGRPTTRQPRTPCWMLDRRTASTEARETRTRLMRGLGCRHAVLLPGAGCELVHKNAVKWLLEHYALGDFRGPAAGRRRDTIFRARRRSFFRGRCVLVPAAGFPPRVPQPCNHPPGFVSARRLPTARRICDPAIGTGDATSSASTHCVFATSRAAPARRYSIDP